MRKFFTTFLVLLCTVSACASQVGVYCLMNSDGTEVFRNDHICARIRLNNQGTALLEVENLTDRVAYVDRARSYAAVNGFSESLYMTFYEQRLQALVPHGTTILYAWEDLPRLLDRDIIYTGKPGGWYESRCKGWFENKRHKFSKGDQRRYRRNNTPLLLTADIQYGSAVCRAYRTRQRLRLCLPYCCWKSQRCQPLWRTAARVSHPSSLLCFPQWQVHGYRRWRVCRLGAHRLTLCRHLLQPRF